MTEPPPNTAPKDYVYCPRCGAPLETRMVGDKPRRACPECNFIYFTDPKVGVGVLVVKGGKILLVRRTMMPERGKWSIPAGFLDRDEDPEEVAVREAYEETNLRVAIDELLDVYYNEPTGQGGASVFILYRARLLGGELEAGDDADAAGFFGPDELPELAFDSTRDAIRMLQQEVDEVE
ncbi:MAG TPA: NUDIX hydrolase [Candidatus Sulfomarinibacteraceae bacterium]|nr:NUDIX hydrolase [Candidatus Sulfomarinibacteraceae bacterium]